MKTDSTNLRQAAAVGILLLAAVLTAFLIVWSVLHNTPISPVADTLGGLLIGFASHELGVSRGSSLSQSASAQGAEQALSIPAQPVQLTQPFTQEPEGARHVGN